MKKDKIVLITGATSGIGKATAKRFVKKGFHVIITGRRSEKLQEIKDKFTEKYSAHIHTLCFDICDPNQVETAINSLPENWKNIQILVNNAGGARGLEPIQDGNIDEWDYMIDANVKGLLYVSRVVSKIMVKNKNGHIINVCSTAGHDVYPNGGVYCATKHAVAALTKGMRYDMFKYGIRVSEVSPGMVEDTDFSLNRFNGDSEKANIYTDINALKAKDVAEIIFYMTSQPKHVNIQSILVYPTQQASPTLVDRSGRKYDEIIEKSTGTTYIE
jgi:3-hydroxy acid dehydrogenase / malonic semialdehyde reductase